MSESKQPALGSCNGFGDQQESDLEVYKWEQPEEVIGANPWH